MTTSTFLNEQSRTAVKTPYEWTPLQAPPGWRSRAGWPLNYVSSAALCDGVRDRTIKFTAGQKDEFHRDILLLAGHHLIGNVAAALEVAVALQKAQEEGVTVIGNSAGLDFLAGRCHQSNGWEGFSGTKAADAEEVRWSSLRRLARNLSWHGPIDSLIALARSEVTVISHNPLLLQQASKRDLGPIGYLHASSLLLSSRQSSRQSQRHKPCALALSTDMLDAMLDDPKLSPEMVIRLTEMLLKTVTSVIDQALSDLLALREARMPKEIWSGTGGSWASRAIGLAALSQGAKVCRFSHGAKDGMIADTETLAYIELASSSQFMLGTRKAAGLAERLGLAQSNSVTRPVSLSGGQGLPLLKSVPAHQVQTSTKSARKVMYAPTIMRGARQLVPALLPDCVYLNWQMTVGEALQNGYHECLLKPHPEGAARGMPHPLASCGRLAEERFEAYLSWADVFVFDWGESTTFWEAVCTNRPILYLDLGLTAFNPEIAPLIRQRCHFLPVSYDERNCPILDVALLNAAISDAPEFVDSGSLREFLIGDL